VHEGAFLRSNRRFLACTTWPVFRSVVHWDGWTQSGRRLVPSLNVDQAAKAMRDDELLAEIEDFIEGFNQPTYRGMRINGQRVATWSSQHGWSGDNRPDAEWIH
jgi:hypothetical protein